MMPPIRPVYTLPPHVASQVFDILNRYVGEQVRPWSLESVAGQINACLRMWELEHVYCVVKVREDDWSTLFVEFYEKFPEGECIFPEIWRGSGGCDICSRGCWVRMKREGRIPPPVFEDGGHNLEDYEQLEGRLMGREPT